jgi:peptidoglycan/xylan/chitin deacetylase (PgdA/CDA1 family)
MYHGIDMPDILPLNMLTVCVEDFEAQIRYFKKKFQILTLEEMFNGFADSNYFSIALTFDDGLRNNYKYAFPILEKYKVPATFFVTGLNEANEKYIWVHLFNNARELVKRPIKNDHLVYPPTEQGLTQLKERLLDMEDVGFEKKRKILHSVLASVDDKEQLNRFMNYWRLMNDDEIKEIAQSDYVRIGSHTYWHNNLKAIPHNYAIKELIDTKRYLEKLISSPVQSVAYPFGQYTRALVDDAEKMGYKYQRSIKYNIYSF